MIGFFETLLAAPLNWDIADLTWGLARLEFDWYVDFDDF